MKKWLAVLCLGVGLAVSACSTGGMDTPQGAAADRDRQVYELYRQYLETLNENRQRAGVAPVQIRSYDEWRQSPSTD